MRAVIPRRNDLPGDRGVLIVSYAAHKKKQYSFFLVQVGGHVGQYTVLALCAALQARVWSACQSSTCVQVQQACVLLAGYHGRRCVAA